MPLYRHKLIRRFKIGKFEFKNNLLKTRSEEEDKEFQALLKQLPRREVAPIVQMNEEAMASLEKPAVSGGVVRGAQQSKDITVGKTNPGTPTEQVVDPTKGLGDGPSASDGKSGASTSKSQ